MKLQSLIVGALVATVPLTAGAATLSMRVNGPGGYYLVTPEEKSELPRVRAFRNWLALEARDA